MNKIIAVVMLMLCMFSLIGCSTNPIEEDYPSLEGRDTIIHYVEGNEVLDILSKNNSNAIIMFGFERCPWCQAAIQYVDEIAKEKDYKEVLYLDIKDMRDNEESVDRAIYLDIYNKIKEDIGNPDKIYAPTVIVIKEGKITGYNEGTVESHQRVDGVLPVMTDEQVNELRNIYSNIF